VTHGLTKSQLIKQITGSKESVSVDANDKDVNPQVTVEDVFTDATVGAKVKSVELPSETTNMTEAQMTFTLELKRMEMQMAKMKMDLDLKAIELKDQFHNQMQPTFKVEIAEKLLPKLGSDHKLEVYLITFQKIAKLNNWPLACYTSNTTQRQSSSYFRRTSRCYYQKL